MLDIVPKAETREYKTTAAEERLVRELVAKSTYESGCIRPSERGKTRKELHVRVNRPSPVHTRAQKVCMHIKANMLALLFCVFSVLCKDLASILSR